MSDELVSVHLLENCARCGGDHRGLIFKKLSKPAGKNTHWVMCPLRNEPILMRVGQVGMMWRRLDSYE